MLNLKLNEMKTEELNDLLNKIKEELNARTKKKVIYRCEDCNVSNYSKKKRNCWAKVLTKIDDTKTNGYAFAGNFLNLRAENAINEGDYVVEHNAGGFILYKATGDNKKELVAEGYKNELITFIRKCKKILEGE